MGKFVKWLLGLLLLLAVLIVIAIVVLPMVIDPNDYKEQIVAKVKETTGRDLVIRDRLELTVFPTLAVQLGGVSLSNAQGFGDDPFAEVEKLDLRVKVMPLLSSRVEVDTVVVQGLGLNLAKNSSGTTNWADLAGDAPAEAKPQQEESSAAGDFTLAVQGIQIEDARIVWDDKQAGQRYVLDDVKLTTGSLAPGAAVPLAAGLRLSSDAPRLNVILGLDGTVEVDSALSKYSVNGLKLNVEAKGEGLPTEGIAAELSGDLALDQAAGTVSLENLAISGPEIKVTGDLKGAGLNEKPQINASLQLNRTNLKNLLGALGVVVETADPKAMTRVSGNVGLALSDGAANIDPLSVTIDESELTGKVSLPSFDGPIVRAQLNLDRIDLDRYMPPASAPAPAGESGIKSDAAASAKSDAAANPFAGLRTLDLDATVTIGSLKINNLRMSDMKAVIKSKNGVLRVDPAAAKLYGGQFNGLVELDGRKNRPAIRAKQSLKGIQAGSLLQDLIGEDRLLGTGEVESDIRLVGLTEREIRNSLNGTAQFAFRNGAVKGINLAELIRNAKSALGMAAGGADSGKQQTDFTELTASAVIKNGVINNQDLSAKSPLLRVGGKGQVNLPQDSIDYLVTTEIVGSLQGQGGKDRDELSGLPIPIRLTGSLANPKPTVDLEAALEGKVKQKLEEKKEELTKKVEEKVQEKLQGKLKGEVGDKLKGLFGK